MTIGETALVTGLIVSSLVLVAAKIAGNIAGVAATSAIQGGMTMATRAGLISAGTTAAVGAKYGGKGALGIAKYASGKIKDKISSNRLKEASQHSSFARLQQMNSQDSKD